MRLSLGLLLLASCAPPLPVDGAACPCAEGWVCCEGSNVCVTEVGRCPLVPGPEVRPLSVELGVERRFRFTTTSEDVSWSVEEGQGGGSFEAPGVYAAPTQPGTYHVVARARGGVTRATVVVRPLRLSQLAGDPGGPSSRPIDGVGPLARVVDPIDGVVVGDAYYFLDRASPMALRRVLLASGAVETLFRGVRPGDTPRMTDGPRETAQFAFPSLLASSPAGEVLVEDQGCVRALSPAELSVRTLVCPRSGVYGLAATATHVYWSNLTEVRRWDRSSQVTEVFIDAATLSKPGRLAVAGELLFLVDQDGAAVKAVELTTRAVSTRLPPVAGRRFIDVDAWVAAPGEAPEFVALRADGRIEGTSGSQTAIDARSLTRDPAGPDDLLFPAPDSIRRLRRLFLQEVVAGRPSPGAPIQLDGAQASARFVFAVPSPEGVVLAAQRDVVWVSEPLAGTIRTIDRRGVVTTRFTGVIATSMAVDETFVYVITRSATEPPRLRRAPRFGGAWETLPVVLSETPFRLLGALDDGRIAWFEGSAVRFLDGQSGAPLPQRIAVPPPWPSDPITPEAGYALDPAGALWATLTGAARGTKRIDLTTGVVEHKASALGSTHALTFSRGRLSGAVTSPTAHQESVLHTLAPGATAFTPYVGLHDVPMVLPGPLDAARLHAVGAVVSLWNGDLVIADAAENVVLVIE
ncbi:MAG: hypothetical protein JNJ54_15295 [Myxococcaceae bacterium]|nr:hypothetical protein [Myxococcaceae bacterium]